MNRTGVTLVELIIVLAIIGIIALFVTMDVSWFMRDTRLSEARDRLLADIEDVKLKSITTVPHGIVVTGGTNTSYTVVQLRDFRCSNDSTKVCIVDGDCTSPGTCTVTGNFKKDTGETNYTLSTVSLSTSTNVKVNDSGGTPYTLWFDRKGVPRSDSWGFGNRTFTVWYDANGNGSFDADEPNKTIIINVAGRVQYEAR